MAQYIKQGNIFGRIGSGVGKGLAEQLPEELERGRLSAGLKNLGEQQGQSPFQRFAGLVGVAHKYPQVIQSGGELLKQEGLRKSFANAANRQQPQDLIAGGQQQPLPPNIAKQFDEINRRRSPQGSIYKAPSELEEPSPGENPLRPEAVPSKPWSQDRWLGEMADAQERFPDLTNQELMSYVDKKQQRELAAPEAEQAIDQYKKQIQDEANTAFDNALATKLEKAGKKTFEQVPGTLQNKIKRKMINELMKNKSANIKDVADKWSDLAVRRAKALGDIEVNRNKSFFSKSPSKVLDTLNSYSGLFKDLGDSENYKDTLIDKFKFSPERAAQIAYHPSKSAQSFINSIKRTSGNPQSITSNSVKRANDLLKVITPSDSIKSIARHIKDRDPYFNDNLFFKELQDLIQEDERNSPFTTMQKQEISQGGADITPNWADIWYFPIPHGFSAEKRQ